MSKRDENIYGGASDQELAMRVADRALSAPARPDIHGPAEDKRAVSKANVKQPGAEVKEIHNERDKRFTKGN